MESARKAAVEHWHRGLLCCRCCCPANFSLFSTTKTAATPTDSNTTVRLNRNGEVIVSQPNLSNGNAQHYVNGISPRGAPAKALRRLGVNNSQDREFDEIDLGDEPSAGNLLSNEVKDIDKLESRQSGKKARTLSDSIGSSSGVGTMATWSASSKPQSVKSNNAVDAPTTDDSNSEMTHQVIDMMLSDVIQERFDPTDDLPQIIEEDFSNIDMNVISEASAEEIESGRKSERSKAETISAHSLDTDSPTERLEDRNISQNKLARSHEHSGSNEASKITAEMDKPPAISFNFKLERQESESSDEQRSDETDKSKSQKPTSERDSFPETSGFDTKNLQKYGGFCEKPAIEKNRMYGGLDEESSDDEENNNDSRTPTLHNANESSTQQNNSNVSN